MDDEKIKLEIEGIVRQFGEDIYLKNKQLIGLISDTIPNDDKIKKLLILAVQNNIPNKILNIKKTFTSDYDLELKKLAIKFVDDNSIVTEIGYKAVMLFACGVGLAALEDIIWQDNESDLSEIEPASAILKNKEQNGQALLDADRQFEIGSKYYFEDKNYVEAVKCFQIGANEGHMLAQYNLGVCYHYGRGVAQDYREAAKWYYCAASKGYASAQNNLGVLFENGLGQPVDYNEALKWYQKAADQGHKKAQESIIRVEAMCTVEESVYQEDQRVRMALDDLYYYFRKRRKIHAPLGLLQIIFSFLSAAVLESSSGDIFIFSILTIVFGCTGVYLFIHSFTSEERYMAMNMKSEALMKRLKTEANSAKKIANNSTKFYWLFTLFCIFWFLFVCYIFA